MLNLIAVFLVCSGIGIAVHIAIDLTHRPQSMKIMNAVWILSALWGSYLALWAYNKFGRSSPMKAEDDGMKMDMSGMKDMSDMKGMDMSGMKDNMEMDMAMQGEMSMQGMQRPYWQSVGFFVKFGGNLFFISTVSLFFFLNPIKSCRYVCFLVTLKTPHH